MAFSRSAAAAALEAQEAARTFASVWRAVSWASRPVTAPRRSPVAAFSAWMAASCSSRRAASASSSAILASSSSMAF